MKHGKQRDPFELRFSSATQGFNDHEQDEDDAHAFIMIIEDEEAHSKP